MFKFFKNTRGFLFALLILIFITLGGITAILEADLVGSRTIASLTPSPPVTDTPSGLAGIITPTSSSTNTVDSGVPTQQTIEPSATFTAIAGDCTVNTDWDFVVVNVGDTLASIAKTRGISEEELKVGNCLLVDSLQAGTLIYAPELTSSNATNTSTTSQDKNTPIACGPSPTWVLYTVKTGDNLFRLSQAYGVTIAELQFANCLASSTVIIAGNSLYVPDVVQTNTPDYTPTHTATNKPPTATSTKVPTHTFTPSITNTPTNTLTPSNTPTATNTGTSTNTPTSTNTSTATSTPTATP